MDADTPAERPPERRADPSPAARGSRDRLLAAAVELVIEHYSGATDVREAFKYLTPGAVAARAGLSRALIYHHWDDPEDGSGSFASFLGEVADRLWGESSSSQDLIDGAALLPDNITDLVLALADYTFERSNDWAAGMVRATQALALHRVVGAVAGEQLVRELGRVYEVLGAKAGMEPVPPLDHEAVGLAVSCIWDGFVLQNNLMPERLGTRHDWTPKVPVDGEDHGWTLFAIAVEGVIHHMMRPVAAPLDEISSD